MPEDNFSNWIKFENRESLSFINYPGIYVILYSTEEMSQMPFFLTEQPSTILENVQYIGMAHKQTLKARLKQFDNTIRGVRKSHGGADRMKYKYENDKELFQNLYVSILHKEYNPKEIISANLLKMGEVAKLEFIYLAKFLEIYGNLPMFNRKSSPKFSKQQIGSSQ